MKVPKVMDLHSVQPLSSMLRNTDLRKVHKEYLNLPSLPNMADFHRLRDELKTSLPSIDFIPSVSGWHILELLTNCVSTRFSTSKTQDECLLVTNFSFFFSASFNTSIDVVFPLLFFHFPMQQNVKGDLVDGVAPLVIQPITRWPFFAFLGGAMFCLLAGSTCHLLACYSERLAYIMLRLDYAGIAALISTSAYPLVYYSFMCNPFICYLYMGFITVLGVTTIIFSLLPLFQKPHFRSTRASLFFGMGFSGVAPIIHKLILYKNQPEALQTTWYELLMGAFYGTGALIYALRIPERWKPGKFDIAGHSHQLFHILVVAGAYTHYRAGLVYLRWRDTVGC